MGDIMQMTFDLQAGVDAKVRGMSLAENNRATLLLTARSAARIAARKLGKITIDDVIQTMQAYGHACSLGQAAGSVFKGKEWVFTGEWRKSSRVSNHARQNRVWRLR